MSHMIRSRSVGGINDTGFGRNVLPTVMNTFKSMPYQGRLFKTFVIFCAVCSLIYLLQMFMFSPPSNKSRVTSKRLLEKVTIVLNTFKRHNMMNDAIDYYSTCGLVKYIHVVWSENTSPEPWMMTKYGKSQHPENLYSIIELKQYHLKGMSLLLVNRSQSTRKD